MKASIRGLGAVGGFGCGAADLERAMSGRVSANPPAAPVHRADTAMLARFLPAAALRRVDHHSRMAVLAGRLALEDAGPGEGPPGPMGVIVATGMGPTADTLESRSAEADDGEPRLSPIQFSNSVHNAAAAHIAILLGIRGPNLSINHFDLSVAFAFQTALDWLEEGRAATVLVGGIDCFSNALDVSGKIPAGEGSAFFVLTRPTPEASRYPLIQGVRIGGRGPRGAASPPGTLVVHDGSGEGELGLNGPQAVFAPLYGAFPAAMALDVAAAALLLKKDSPLRGLVPGLDREAGARIRCLRKGVSGETAAIDVGR